MSFLANRFVVLLDANVLYPFRMRDVLLHFAAEGLFRPRWTDAIIKEWTQNLIAKRPEAAESVRSQLEAMRRCFQECWVQEYEPLIAGLKLPDLPTGTSLLQRSSPAHR